MFKKGHVPWNLIKPNLQVSGTLAYIVAVLLGDGYLRIRKYADWFRYDVCLKVKDKAFAESFARALEKIGLHPHIRCRKDSGQYLVTATSVEFFKWFKGLDYEDIKKIASEYPVDFLRGFFESEGSISKHRQGGKCYYQVVIGNTDKKLISLVREIIEKLGYRTSLHILNQGKYKPEYQLLVLGNVLEKAKFVNLIKPSIRQFPLSEEDIRSRYRIFANTENMVKF